MSFLHRLELRLGLTRGDVTVVLFLAGAALIGFVYTEFFEGRDQIESRKAFLHLVERYDSAQSAHQQLLAGGLRIANDSDSVARPWQPLTEQEVLEERSGSSGSEVSRKKKLTLNDVAPVDINTAPASVLELLPGIGPKIAERIIALRAATPYGTIEDILKVKGIGPKKFALMKPYLTVGSTVERRPQTDSISKSERVNGDSGNRR